MDADLQAYLDTMRKDLKSDFDFVTKELRILNGTVQTHTTTLAVIAEREKSRRWTVRAAWAALLAVLGQLIYDLFTRGK